MASKFTRYFLYRNYMGNNKANDDFISCKNNELLEKNNKNGLGFYSEKDFENIIQYMKYIIGHCTLNIKEEGLIKNFSEKCRIKKDFKWSMKISEINCVRVSYNDKFITKLKKKDIKEGKKENK